MLKTTKYVLDSPFCSQLVCLRSDWYSDKSWWPSKPPGPTGRGRWEKWKSSANSKLWWVVWCGVVWSDLLWWLLYCSWCGGWGGGGCHMLLPGGLLVRAHCGNSHCGGRGAIWWWLVLWLDWTGCEARWEEDRQGGRQCWAPPHSVTATSYISLHQHHHTN